MRDALVWSYSAAGFMNTVNAAGYLIGALLASRIIRRFGWLPRCAGKQWPAWSRWCCRPHRQFCRSELCPTAGRFCRRGRICRRRRIGGNDRAMAARARQLPAEPVLRRARHGILLSGLIAPSCAAFGPGSWWIMWWALTLLAIAMTIPLLLTPISSTAGVADAAAAPFEVPPVLIYLAGYFLFGAGYIAYMTFMIAYVRDGGGGAAAQSAFWSLIGLSAFATPWVFRRCWRSTAAGFRPPSFSASTQPARPCRSSGIRRCCWRYRRWCSASRTLPWWDRPPPSYASTTRRRPGRTRSRMTIAFGIGQTSDRSRWRHHRRHGKLVICVECLGGDACGGRGGVGISAKAGA